MTSCLKRDDMNRGSPRLPATGREIAREIHLFLLPGYASAAHTTSGPKHAGLPLRFHTTR